MNNQQRRIFCGRGGPTDRRLPKHSARRRRRPLATPQGETLPCTIKDPEDTVPVALSESVAKDDSRVSLEHLEELMDSTTLSTDETRFETQESRIVSTESAGKVSSTGDDAPIDLGNERESSFQSEVNHLLQRIRNNKVSIRTSQLALSKPSTHETNVLRAVKNCATEWKAILRHYRDELGLDDTSNGGTNVTTKEASETLCKATGLALFELVQSALQCGPLAGAKPGYFKRCGGETAKMVLEFLVNVAPDRQVSDQMYWTKKQADAIERWKLNASKAAQNDKPISKSVQEKLHKANNSSNSRKKHE